MKTKKILLLMSHLATGGITSSFLNLLSVLKDDPQYDIDVLLFDADDQDKIPEGIRVLTTNRWLRLLAVGQEKIMQENKLLGLFRLLLGAVTRLFGDGPAYRLLLSTYKKIGPYDAAVSFAQSGRKKSLYGGMNEFVLWRTKAKEKISFLHCDYQKCGIHNRYSEKLYQQFDKIAAVSQGVREVFLQAIPDLSDRVFVVHNCHRFAEIRKKALLSPYEYPKGKTNLITVARISAEKGHFRVLPALSRLKKEGFSFTWHIIGGGDFRLVAELREKISEYGLAEDVVFHGNQENPYRYFVNADGMLLPSYHEAAPMVFAEAECLYLPVLATETTSAKELVEEKHIGLVCENDDEALYRMLSSCLEDPEGLKRIQELLKSKQPPSNDEAKAEFDSLILN